MTGLLIFNAVMILLGVGIVGQIVPAALLGESLRVLHVTFGITTPPPEKVRTIALIWIGALTVLADGLLFLFVYLAFQLK
jgi:hypothetical protein